MELKRHILNTILDTFNSKKDISIFHVADTFWRWWNNKGLKLVVRADVFNDKQLDIKEQFPLIQNTYYCSLLISTKIKMKY